MDPPHNSTIWMQPEVAKVRGKCKATIVPHEGPNRMSIRSLNKVVNG